MLESPMTIAPDGPVTRWVQFVLSALLLFSCRSGGSNPSQDTSSTGDNASDVPRDTEEIPMPTDDEIDASLPEGEVYWASPKGSAAWVACKSESPLNGAAACSLETANQNAAPGDLVYLREGDYNTGIDPVQSGSEANDVAFSGYNKENAHITGVEVGINAFTKSHLTVNAVNVDGVDVFVDMRSAHHIRVLNSNLVRSSDQGGWPVGVLMYRNSMYNLLANCNVGDVGYMTSDDDIGGVINIGSWEDPEDTTAYNRIEGNHFFHGGHHILEMASRYNIIRGNSFHNEDWTPCDRPSTNNLCGNRDIILEDDTPDAYRNVIEGNVFGFAGASIENEVPASGASIRTPNNILRNNVFCFNGGTGLGLYVDSDTTYDARENYVYHNVMYRNGIAPAAATDLRYSFGMTFDNVAGTDAPLPIENVSVINNLFYQNAGGDIFFYYTDYLKQTVLHNYYAVATGSDETGMITFDISAVNLMRDSDPRFLDVSMTSEVENLEAFDFRLQNDSPAIDRGVFLTTTTEAGSGKTLPVRDAGFFMDGYGIVQGDQIQLEGQSETARIVGIDYESDELTLDTSLTWTADLGVSLSYNGSAPDIGLLESVDIGSSESADIGSSESVQ